MNKNFNKIGQVLLVLGSLGITTNSINAPAANNGLPSVTSLTGAAGNPLFPSASLPVAAAQPVFGPPAPLATALAPTTPHGALALSVVSASSDQGDPQNQGQDQSDPTQAQGGAQQVDDGSQGDSSGYQQQYAPQMDQSGQGTDSQNIAQILAIVTQLSQQVAGQAADIEQLNTTIAAQEADRQKVMTAAKSGNPEDIAKVFGINTDPSATGASAPAA